jgi:predicted hotdog family 3-hydroxylacyl-ACP dehydratase
MTQALFSGEQVKELIPQREPMIMIDAFYGATEDEAETGLTVEAGNIFCSAEGVFTEPGLVEHIAQSASAFAGYKAVKSGSPAPLGFIGEVRKFGIHFLPGAGSELRTKIKVVSEALGVTLLNCETVSGDRIAAQGQMKIYIKANG